MKTITVLRDGRLATPEELLAAVEGRPLPSVPSKPLFCTCPRCGRGLVPDEIGDAFCGCGNRITFSLGDVIGVKPLDDGWETAYADVLQNASVRVDE